MRDNMDKKATAILKAWLDVCNERRWDKSEAGVSLFGDFGGNTLTVQWGGDHTHVGNINDSFEKMIDQLYSRFCE